MDDTVAIESSHRRQHCSTLGGVPCYVFGQELRLGMSPSLPRAVKLDPSRFQKVQSEPPTIPN